MNYYKLFSNSVQKVQNCFIFPSLKGNIKLRAFLPLMPPKKRVCIGRKSVDAKRKAMARAAETAEQYFNSNRLHKARIQVALKRKGVKTSEKKINTETLKIVKKSSSSMSECNLIKSKARSPDNGSMIDSSPLSHKPTNSAGCCSLSVSNFVYADNILSDSHV